MLVLAAALVMVAVAIAAGAGLLRSPSVQDAPPVNPNGVVAYRVGGEIRVRDVEDQTARVLVRGSGTVVWHAWSPDGSRLAFLDLEADEATASLRVSNADGSDVRVIEDRVRGGFHFEWSPSGQLIALARARGRISVISVIDLSGRAQRRDFELPLTRDVDEVHWHPNGREVLAFDLADGSIIAMSVGGDGALREVIPAGDAEPVRGFLAFAISPDGRYLAAESREGLDVQDLGAGRMQTAVVDNASWPVFSPDGTRLAVTFETAVSEVRVLVGPPDDFATDATTVGPVFEARPSVAFSPDGAHVLMVASDGSGAWLADIHSGLVRHLDWEEHGGPISWQRRT